MFRRIIILIIVMLVIYSLQRSAAQKKALMRGGAKIFKYSKIFFHVGWIGAVFFGAIAVLAARDKAYIPATIFTIFFVVEFIVIIISKNVYLASKSDGSLLFQNWNGKKVKFTWSDIKRIKPSRLYHGLKIELKNKRKAVFTFYFDGSLEFLQLMKDNLEESTYSSSNKFIEKYKRSVVIER